MAYAFDEGDEDKDAKADVFTTPELQPGAPPPGGPVEKTSTDTTIPQAGAEAPPPGEAARTPTIRGPGRSEAFRRATRTTEPQAFGRIRAALGKEEGELESEKQTYLANAETPPPVTTAQIESAISGDGSLPILTPTLPTPPPAFAPSSVGVAGTPLLRTQAGWGELIRPELGEQGTPGEMAFEAAILGRNPEFWRTAEALGAQQTALDTAAGSTAIGEQRAAAELAAVEAERQRVRNLLSGEAMAVSGAVEGRPVAAPGSPEQERLRAIQEDLIAQTYNLPPDVLEKEALALEQKRAALRGMDLSQFAPYVTETVAGSQATAQEAGRFNRIMGLLGQTDTMGYAPIVGGSVDEAGAQAAMAAAAAANVPRGTLRPAPPPPPTTIPVRRAPVEPPPPPPAPPLSRGILPALRGAVQPADRERIAGKQKKQAEDSKKMKAKREAEDKKAREEIGKGNKGRRLGMGRTT
jgi:hypothetical protein